MPTHTALGRAPHRGERSGPASRIDRRRLALGALLSSTETRSSAKSPQVARRSWPAFLVGCHRSGTTLLRRLLDSHPHIACPPESKFIAGFEAFLTYPQTAR